MVNTTWKMSSLNVVPFLLLCAAVKIQAQVVQSNLTGYSCSDDPSPCDTYSFYKAQAPYYLDLVNISYLFGVTSSKIAEASDLAPETLELDEGQPLLIPITCGCTRNYSQANISYRVKSGDTMYKLSTGDFENLTTYQAVMVANPTEIPQNLSVDETVVVPIRCQCPSKAQKQNEIKWQITYVVQTEDTVESISKKFGANLQELSSLNGMPDTIVAGSTLLVPVSKKPALAQFSGKNSKNSSQRLAIIFGILGSAIVGTASVCIFAIRKKIHYLILKKQTTLATDDKEKDAPQKMLFKKEQIVFSLQTLIEATAGFSSTIKLGEGGFGYVYKGVIQDGQEIAVKKLLAMSGQGTREFMNEVEIVANIQHRNLVKLLGCCVEGDERLLVYELLPNKSLDTFLFDPMKSRQLDWEKRYNIIAGIARGLLYLHQDSQVRIIHRDIKANNILLDEKLNPKIADFGLARLFADNETEILSRVAGTYGYMAPEYAMGGQLSVKVDVYSFGVLLLEIVSGRKNTDMKLMKEKQMFSLLEWAWELHKQGNVLSMVDGAVAETCPEEQASRCIKVGLLCTQADADVRPSMSTVLLMLTSNSEALPNPRQPAFVSMGQRPTVSQNPFPDFTSITVTEAR